MFTAILDIVVVFLLLMTIVFCWRLNGKILELKAGRKDLIDLIKSLDSAVIKTNSNIHDLKLMTENSAVELSSLVNRARESIDDLSFMNDTASKLTDRLEKSISESRYILERLRGDINDSNVAEKRASNDYSSGTNLPNPGFNKARKELLNALKVMK